MREKERLLREEREIVAGGHRCLYTVRVRPQLPPPYDLSTFLLSRFLPGYLQLTSRDQGKFLRDILFGYIISWTIN